MWYRGSAGDDVNIRRTIGASSARSAIVSYAIGNAVISHVLTIAVQVPLIHTRADDHNVVHDRETAFATNPHAVTMSHSTVCQHRRLVHGDLFLMKLLRVRQLISFEEFPS